MSVFFKKGPLFYLIFNFRLFLSLIFKKTDLLIANDLDTLLPNYLVSKLKNVKLIYDSHEIFTEVPELADEPIKKRIWKSLENYVIPKLKHCITVNDSIAEYFFKEYKIKFIAIRNIPDKNKFTGIKKERIELNLSKEKKIIILQGSGINIDRGAEELVMSMKYLSENYLLLIIGGGDVINELKKISQIEKLNSKVIFIPRLKPEELYHYTINSDLGITIDKDTNLNYRFSLPNKIFDYLNAGIPVLASKLPEVEKLINKYEVGFFINNHSPEHIAEMIESSLESDKYNSTRKNTYKASIENSWEIEKKQWDLIL